MEEITVAQLADELQTGALLFDVREPDEYVEAHVPGAQLIPLSEITERVQDFPLAARLLLICRSGGRSRRAGELLQEHGRQVVNVEGGTLAWQSAGFDVATGTEPT
jgi:rhodanese-related sulfurtransferase